MEARTHVVAGNPELQDRVEIFHDANRTIIALADGAGGISGGAQAAELFVRTIEQKKSSLQTDDDCEAFLHNIDRILADDPNTGETTGIVIILSNNQTFGASAGDSEAWLFSTTAKTHLTKGQFRKPFLGSGEALAVKFTAQITPGTLLVATDGLWKYTSYEKIHDQIQASPDNLPERLTTLVRLRSGALQDDIAMALIELA